MASWRTVIFVCAIGLALAVGACGRTGLESPTAPTAVSYPSLAGLWRASLITDLRDREGGEWGPNPSFRPPVIVSILCVGFLAVTSQNGRTFAGWFNLTLLHRGYDPYCPPSVVPSHSGAISQDGARITLRLPRREVPDCEYVSGDS